MIKLPVLMIAYIAKTAEGSQEEIAYPVSCIFRKSLEEGAIPDDWKVANVNPIFKKGRLQTTDQ